MVELYPGDDDDDDDDDESSSCCRMCSLCSLSAEDAVADVVLTMLWAVLLEVHVDDSVVIPDVVVTPTLVRMKSSSASGAEKEDVPSLLPVALFHAPI